jgi:hypothetical protein
MGLLSCWPCLYVISCLGAGYDKLDVLAALERRIQVSNSPSRPATLSKICSRMHPRRRCRRCNGYKRALPDDWSTSPFRGRRNGCQRRSLQVQAGFRRSRPRRQNFGNRWSRRHRSSLRQAMPGIRHHYHVPQPLAVRWRHPARASDISCRVDGKILAEAGLSGKVTVSSARIFDMSDA